MSFWWCWVPRALSIQNARTISAIFRVIPTVASIVALFDEVPAPPRQPQLGGLGMNRSRVRIPVNPISSTRASLSPRDLVGLSSISAAIAASSVMTVVVMMLIPG